MMETVKKFSTPIAEVYLEDGIIYVNLLPKNITLEEAQGHQNEMDKHLKSLYPGLCITDATLMKQIDKGARDYFASHTNMRAVAVITGSVIAKLAANLFLQFNKPKFPTKLFTEKDKAVEWLKQQG